MFCRSKAILSYCFFFSLAAQATTADALRVPSAFVENHGQASGQVRYVGIGSQFRSWFGNRGVILQKDRTIVEISFAGGADGRITADRPTSGTVNYLRGNDRGEWQSGLPMFGTLHYRGVWPGIEIRYEAENGGVKAEYEVAPGAEAGKIRLHLSASARIEKTGALRLHGESGDFVEETPVLYQSIGGRRVAVDGGFKMLADNSIGFWTGEYDHSQPLVIDPSIAFSGYFGGSSQDVITAMTLDAQNNIIVTGYTSSTDLPATGGARPKYAGSVDVFVASFTPNGGSLNYCTYLGGSGRDQAAGIAVDASRNVYITGYTSSTNFPAVAAYQSHLSGTRDAFVAKLNAAGNALLYSTYFGGSGVDTASAITVDSTGAAYIVGDTTSTNLPATGFMQPKLRGGQDAFMAKLAPAGNTLSFVTYLGGSGTDHAAAVHLGGVGNIFIAGYTMSTDFPTLSAYQPKSGGGQDGFLTKITSDGKTLKLSTYLGGYAGSAGAPEEINAIWTDGYNNIIVAGTTSSPNFPVTAGAYQTTFGGQTDGFITRFNVSGQLTQSTFLGGMLADGINAMAMDFHGNPYVTGFTSSLDFPVQRPLQNSNAGSMDAFVVKMNPALSTALFGTYLGGSGSDSGNAIAVDSETSMVVSGETSSADLPVAGNLQNSLPATLSSFITKITPSFTIGVGYAFQGQMTFTVDPWHVASYTASAAYGTATDIPVAGDWTGSGVKRIGIFRNGTWILDTNGNGVLDAADKTVAFGQAGDVPIVGDWRGTGRIALGLFRNGTFILDLSGHLSGTPTGLQDATFAFGQGGDVPVAGDWNGSGPAKVGIFRNGLWLLDYNGDHVYNGSDRAYTYGQAGDIPVVGDWDSSGIPNKLGVYRAGVWVLDYDGDGVWATPGLTEMTIGFGFAGYSPLVF
ncbi:MAG TPA: SBBP repeat-containing protein [Bryobacteraceae bacterium]|nr:SBBP repeat-containing protein [Bryobacteraceae bacterium]